MILVLVRAWALACRGHHELVLENLALRQQHNALRPDDPPVQSQRADIISTERSRLSSERVRILFWRRTPGPARAQVPASVTRR